MKARLPQGYGKQSPNAMMKQVQMMQAQMETAQAELAAKEYTASAGGAMVEATVTGSYEVTAIRFQPEAIDPDDAEMLGDLAAAAVNAAIKMAKDDSEQTMASITGGLNLGGLL